MHPSLRFLPKRPLLSLLLSVASATCLLSSLHAADAPDLGTPPTPEAQKAYAELSKRSVLVQPLAAGSHWFYVNFRGAERADAALYGLLKDAPGTVDLDLSNQKFAEADLGALKALVNLRKLNLSKSTVTDAALANLSGMAKLESLNLFQTEIGDAGLVHLAGCKALKRVYIYQTKATDAGVAQLKAALPGLSVERGGALLLPPPKKEEPKKEEPKKEEPKKEEPKKEEPKK